MVNCQLQFYSKTMFKINLCLVFQLLLLLDTSFGLRKSDLDHLDKRHQVRIPASSESNLEHNSFGQFAVLPQNLKVQSLNGTYTLNGNSTSPKISPKNSSRKKTKRKEKKSGNEKKDNPISGKLLILYWLLTKTVDAKVPLPKSSGLYISGLQERPYGLHHIFSKICSRYLPQYYKARSF